MNKKQRIKQLEKAKAKRAVNLADVVGIKHVDYRTTIIEDENGVVIPDPPGAIPIRLIDLTQKDGEHDNE